ncbi:MAG TPA: sulfur carrier protein ThiS adenylyltransferase ThiF [Tenuifilaceae bacterium]|nr:sulfur carrier protein ThiS adenylyltransferase ThiF [Tenuifilaceae bacterium]HOZ15128.1 sulfur carrier protein ThiS adenylyltransferase ThiF [Tenuifilaceae bacterium]HPI44689.1 sulfur carrier protein ThiS adenylyltransferase ThiF [Tenuifilaceae bacterium]HPN21560.1 sulfur carrier protein ThiS adenylyltransferase ThiF [Tenuifilaceae bacterium]
MLDYQKIKSILKNHTVGIAGAGGLGSNVAMSLTRVGIGKLIIVDFDVVTESNLNRQFYFKHQVGFKKVDALRANLLSINPDLILETHDTKLDASNILNYFQAVDVMVEAFDRAEMKQIIIEKFQIEKPEIPLVVGNGMAGWGNSNDMRVQQYETLYICGDGVSEVADNLPPIAPRVNICAAMEANVVLSILLNKVTNIKVKP